MTGIARSIYCAHIVKDDHVRMSHCEVFEWFGCQQKLSVTRMRASVDV